jgi:molecular chaperone DnaK (HSP70)
MYRVDVNKKVIVFDFGAHSATATLLNVVSGVISVVGSVRDDSVGGRVIEQKLEGYVADAFQRKHKTDVRENKKSLLRIKQGVLQALRILASSTSASIVVDSLHDGIDFSESINRAKFSGLCDEIFKKALESITAGSNYFNISIQFIFIDVFNLQ